MLVYNTEDSNDAPSQTILDFQRDVAQGFGMGGHSDGFQWIRVDDDGMSNAADIAGAASNAHTPVEADVGKKVRVKVSFTDDGICGRTLQVRDALLAEISGVSDCADVTATHLAAISGNLGLNDTGITALAAGDFAGLTALERLNLSFNELTTLDAGVFAELTALERPDHAGPLLSVSERQRPDHAGRRGFRRADRAGASVSGRQRPDHAVRRRVRGADRVDQAGPEGQSRGALRARGGGPAR